MRAPSLTVQLFKLSLVTILFTSSATSLAGESRSCNWAQVPVNLENPYKNCAQNADAYLEKFRSCNPDNSLAVQKKVDLLVQREQFKLNFTQELFYISRLDPKSKYFEKVWSDFERRWRSRIYANKALLEIDKIAKLKNDRCTLHIFASLDCDSSVPAINFIQMKKQQAIQGYANLRLTRRIPEGTLYSLIEAQLIAESSNYLTYNSSGMNSDEKFRNSEINKSVRTYVLNYYPELHIHATLAQNLDSLISARKLTSKVNAKANGRFLTLAQRKQIVDQVMIDSFTERPLSKNLEDGFDYEFIVGQNMIFAELDRPLKKGLVDRLWLMTQDLFVFARLRLATEFKQVQESGFLQAQMCINYINAREKENDFEKFKLTVGGLALLSGVGLFFEVSAVLETTLTVSNLGLIGTISAVDLYGASKKIDDAKIMYLLHEGNFGNLDAAEKELIAQVPWVLINASMAAPVIALKQISAAKKVAEAAKDSERIAELEKFQKAVVLASTSLGIGLAGVSVYDAVDVYKDLNRK